MAERTWVQEVGTLVPGTVLPAPTLHDPPGAGEVIQLLPRSPILAPGERFGAFTLVQRLGAGASGEVWEAVDRRIDAPVALKIFASNASQLIRVMAEARAASRVVSDYVVYVREAGDIEGTGYIAMALCREEGPHDAAPRVARPLTDTTPFSLDEAVRWGEQIARGMAAAHAAGVYHRDLKPENVLCLPVSRNVRIVDFGLVPLVHAARAQLSGPLTGGPGETAGFVAGTPGYMAPEQARGFRRPPDPEQDAAELAAIDVFGVGVTLWALLTGRAPHGEAESVEKVLARASSVPVPDLRTVPTRFQVSPRLARIVARATAPDPRDRYPTAAALAVDLARFRANEPISLDAPYSPVRPLLAARRNPALVAAGAWVIALVAGLVALVSVQQRWLEASANLADLEADLGVLKAESAEVRAHADAETRRADEASNAATASAARAESAEEHAEHLRDYAARMADASRRARDEAAAARTAEAESLAAALEADVRTAAARKEAEESAARAAAAQFAKAEAEQNRVDAERARERAERTAAEAEAARATAEAARATAESARSTAEAARSRAEAEAAEARRTADAAERARAEAERALAELRAAAPATAGAEP